MLDASAGDASSPRAEAHAEIARRRDLTAYVWAGVLAALVLLPVWLRSGFVLSYDLVAVPQQRLQPWMWGGAEAPPRAVPQDVFVSFLDDVVPGAVLQRVLLTALLLAAGIGMAWLAAPHGRIGQVVAVSAYVWSVFVYERLVIGHWGLLLAYAAMPMLVAALAAARRGTAGAAPVAVLVVALGTWVPTGGLLLVLVALALVWWPGTVQAPGARLLTSAGVLAVQLTWVVPAVMTASSAETAPQVFGLRAESVPAAIVAAVSGAGIWNPRAAPASRDGVLAIVAFVMIVAALVAGLPAVRRGLGGRTLTPLLAASLVLGAWAVATAVPALDGLVQATQELPGGGLLRDAQKWLVPWWLVCALAFGATARRIQLSWARGDAVRVLPYALALLPLVLLPELALAAFGRLTPARYPDGWEQARSALAQAPDDDLVVSLPWSTFRRYAWNDDRTVLDPAPRYLPRTVVTDTTLLVTGADGQPIAVPSDDALSTRVEQALRSDDPLTALRAQGVGWILVQRGQPAAPGAPGIPDLTLTTQVVGTDDLELSRIPGAIATPGHAAAAPVLAAWLVLGGVSATALGALLAARRNGERENERDI